MSITCGYLKWQQIGCFKKFYQISKSEFKKKTNVCLTMVHCTILSVTYSVAVIHGKQTTLWKL